MAINEQEALEIAKARVISDGVMSLAGCRELVEDGGTVWHVLFPTSDMEVLSGEPHVLVDKIHGAVTEAYYTQ